MALRIVFGEEGLIMTKPIARFSLWAAAVAMAAAAIPAQAQFRSIFRDAQRGAEQSDDCEKGSSGDTARGVLGGILGGAAGRTARNAGLGTFVPLSEFSDQITKEIACILDADEQKQAAEATGAITKITQDEEGNESPPEVGRSASWTSESRDGVSGTSTITSREASSGENDCITVTDVIIVEGEETRAEKRMCRLAGSPRYTIVA